MFQQEEEGSNQEEGDEYEEEAEGNKRNYLKNGILIDMNKITELMKKRILCQSITCGFAIYGVESGVNVNIGANTSMYSSNQSNYYKQLNSETIQELAMDMGTRAFNSLSIQDINSCFAFYTGNPTIRMSSNIFKSHLFETPFDIHVVDNSGVSIAELGEDIREIIINNFWMPALNLHYDWIKTCGICPFYYEPIGIKLNGRIIIHYILQVPHVSSGLIYTYMNGKGKQNYVWRWTVSGPVSGTNIGAIGMNDIFLFDHGDEFGGINDDSIFRNDSGIMFNIGGDNVVVKKSRYMFFDVRHPPLLNGRLTSDIMTLIPEWTLLKTMMNQIIEAGDGLINPEAVIEFSPDINASVSGDHIDMMRLQIELIKERQKSPLAGLDNYSSVFGQQIPTTTDALLGLIGGGGGGSMEGMNDGLGGTIPSFPGPASALSRIYNDRNNLMAQQNASNFAEFDLNIADGSNFGNVRGGGGGSNGELERYIVYAKNHPGSDVDRALKNIGIKKLMSRLGGGNYKYLAPFEKLSSSAPKPVMPNYNVQFFHDRLDKMISSVCDFPLELFRSGGGAGGGGGGGGGLFSQDVGYSSKMDIFKERLKTGSKVYELFLKQTWVMAYAPFVKNKKKELKKNKKYLEYDINFIHVFEQIVVTFPRTPFLEPNDFLVLHQLGVIETEEFVNYLTEKYGLQKKELTPEMIKKIEKKIENYTNVINGIKEDEGEEGGDQPKKKNKEKNGSDSTKKPDIDVEVNVTNNKKRKSPEKNSDNNDKNQEQKSKKQKT